MKLSAGIALILIEHLESIFFSFVQADSSFRTTGMLQVSSFCLL
jgi:hypothetical protein